LRDFFREKNYCEVMTPVAAREVIIDAHISPWQAYSSERTSEKYFLQSSPEMHHKRLLAQGMGSLFEIAHVFRAEERGSRHHPEFLMLEWYGVNTDHLQQMELVEMLVREIWQAACGWFTTYGFPGTSESLSPKKFKRCSYYELFYKEWKINPHQTSILELASIIKELGLSVPTSGMNEIDDWLNFLLTEYLEPRLLSHEPVFLVDYPISQSALARLRLDERGNEVASRFELYVSGVELCNGYHEQRSALELESRMKAQSELRASRGNTALPYCEKLIEEMALFFPECAGVALGLDRLLMLAGGFDVLDDVVAFAPE
jgi:lysyl-tRNA synthetase class 2